MMYYTKEMLNSFFKATQIKLRRRLYLGNGILYTLSKFPNRVIKIVGVFDDSTLQNRLKILKLLQNKKSNSIVKIYDVGHFKHESYYMYYYIMEKLKNLPYNEDRDIAKIVDRYYGDRKIPSFVSYKLKKFLTEAREIRMLNRLYYNDIHEYNIMMNDKGNFKFVDLESFVEKGNK